MSLKVKRADPRVTLIKDNLDFSKQTLTPYVVRVPITGLYRRAFKGSQMDTQLVYGSKFNVHIVKRRWAWGQEVPATGKSGYVGYVPLSALGENPGKPKHRIKTLRAPVFVKPDLKSQVRILLPLNAQLATTASVGDYYEVFGVGYVHKNHCIPAKSRGGDFVAIAEQHNGLPYIWGGIGPDGLDCSGLVLSSLRAVGRATPRDTDMQKSALGKRVDIVSRLSGLKRGDLVFWNGHVGIMTNSKTLLHANAHHMSVQAEPLNIAARRIAKIAGPITSIKRFGWY
ncbi:MAG: C40 family peptidase [Hyphomonadaceae bacterium]|nr:C40 family peptidase [Hyphomonadaceae bacterium]